MALQLGRALEAAGFALIDQGAQAGGEDAVVICWTPAAVASDHVNMEAARARKAKTFTPIILAPCTPPRQSRPPARRSLRMAWRLNQPGIPVTGEHAAFAPVAPAVQR